MAMSKLVEELARRGLISPPGWLAANVHYLTMAGSQAYGVATEESSDLDLYGVCIPPKEVVFPHLAGEIWGFGKYKEGMPRGHFGQYQKAHVNDPVARHGQGVTYDFQIYNIVKYVQLCSECNPNLIDTLFTPEPCVLHCTRVGRLLRDNRKRFLHRGVCEKFLGYACSQVKKLHSKEPQPGSRRAGLVETYGYDVKFGYHVVRLLLEAEQILAEGDLELRRHCDVLIQIRQGGWSLTHLMEFFESKRLELEALKERSSLPERPDMAGLRDLLLACLEAHYGSLEGAVVVPGRAESLLREIREKIEEAGY
jgi:predicted nucleotidyltransferase